MTLPVLVKFSIFHPLLRIALIRFHDILDLLNIDAVTLEDFFQDLYQFIQSLWLHHFGVLHLYDVVEISSSPMLNLHFLQQVSLKPTLQSRLLFIGQRCNLGASW